MLILTRPKIEALIDYRLAAEAIEDAYRAVSRGDVNLPSVGHITFPAGADCHIKYGHIAGDPIFVIKVATGFPGNAVRGLPTGNGMTLVLSAETGAVRAVLHDEMMLTDIRTGLGGAIATRLFARKDSRCITIIGSGVQAYRQIEAHAALLGNHLSFRIWARSPERAQRVVDQLAGIADITVADDLEQACRKADVIVTTTGSTAPIIDHAWVRRGTHITAIGADAPGKQELDTALICAADHLYADLAAQCLDHGELATAARLGLIQPTDVIDLGDVLLDPSRGRSGDDAITIADLTGLAAQDIAIAKIVLNAHDDREGKKRV